jgi:protein TonB
MRVGLSEPRSWRRLHLAAAASLLLHLSLFALVFFLGGLPPLVVARRGEPILVELPNPEDESAPRGNPALPLAPPPQPARPPAPKSPPAPKPAPRIETARPAPKAEPEGTTVPATPKEEEKGEPRTALAKPPAEEGRPGSDRPGGGGGLRGGRGGIEGEPIPLDTADPRYTDYFDQIRRRIKANWVYPREAGERGIGGQLVIEFAIRKDGWLQIVDLKRSSGVSILDEYALNALKLAQPFPPVPDSVSKGPLLIAGIFTYQIVDSGLLNQYLR